MVAVAQLVEPWIVIPVVVGSSPISHPKFSKVFQEFNRAGPDLFLRAFMHVPRLTQLVGI